MVKKSKVEIATRYGLVNVDALVRAKHRVGIPFRAACALMQMESMGKNIYGHDAGGVFNVPGEKIVTEANFKDFHHRVVDLGEISNGVGPCQITYAGVHLANGSRDGGFFREMEAQHLKPWVPEDNMVFGLRLIWSSYQHNGHSWEKAGTAYNGAASYGRLFEERVHEWYHRLNPGRMSKPVVKKS